MESMFRWKLSFESKIQLVFAHRLLWKIEDQKPTDVS